MARFARLLVAAALILAVAVPASTAHAQAPLTPLFTMSGVLNTAGGLVTVFACTNTDTGPVTVGAEIFGSGGGASLNVASATAVSISPGASVTLATTTPPSMPWAIGINPGIVSGGSAHILTTSKKVTCTAFVADAINSPPTSTINLTMAYKGKQKGD